MSGLVVYRGPTALPGQRGEVALVLTGLDGESRNDKTGPVVQAWSLPTDVGEMLPAATRGREGAVCGRCPHRPVSGGGCYVNVAWAPTNVYRAMLRGSYADVSPGRAAVLLAGLKVRWGAWGEPPAIPRAVYEPMLEVLAGWTGFTHAWRDLDATSWDFLMASCDSASEARQAQAAGWRTFRVRPRSSPEMLVSERVCPASAEAGHLLTCERCGQCDGTRRGARRPDRVIYAHGSGTGRHERLRQSMLFPGRRDPPPETGRDPWWRGEPDATPEVVLGEQTRLFSLVGDHK